MTRLSARKTRLVLFTDDTVRFRRRERAVVVEVNPHTAVVRLEGTRTRFEISWAGVYDRAAKITAERARAERKARKAGTR